jgi:hypothetical protein
MAISAGVIGRMLKMMLSQISSPPGCVWRDALLQLRGEVEDTRGNPNNPYEGFHGQINVASKGKHF